MKKRFRMENLECANCAAKMQEAIGKLDGVNEVSISFMTQSMMLDCAPEKESEILAEAEKICRKFEKSVKIIF